jgi:hypothetical protein
VAGQRWQGVRMTEIERQQLKLLRHELGQLAGGEHEASDFKVGQLAA